MERETGFEPATSTLARLRSTIELFPLLAIRIIEIAVFVNSRIHSGGPQAVTIRDFVPWFVPCFYLPVAWSRSANSDGRQGRPFSFKVVPMVRAAKASRWSEER
jgi:hypothetical protein